VNGMIEFCVPGKPRGKGRPRFSRNGHAYTPAETAAYENLIALACSEAKGDNPALTGPVAVYIRAYKEPPKSASKRKREAMLVGDIRPTNKPDLDNIIKAVLDGCNGVAYLDDKQIVELSTEVWYADEPRIEVKIKEVG
jgi:Holliday junction resolvase RusA-like endonuclease